MLEEIFVELASQYTKDDKLIHKYWDEINSAYSKAGRHYHTLQHLQNLLVYLQALQSQINNWNAVVFALYYHDVVYNTLKHDNEERSAALALKRMKEIGVDEHTIKACSNIILATKKHEWNSDNDINLFTDADLSILGASWNDYELYSKQVRKEYSIYPDMIYNPGRKKVLQHFLSMERIYKSDYFFGRLEKPARENLKQELEQL